MSFRGPFILIFALDQQLARLLNASMADAPLRPDEFAVTSVLRLTGEVRPTELAATIGMRPTSLSNYLRRLGDAGLVTRRPDPRDGRSVLVSLTRRGVRQTEQCFPAFEAAITAFGRHLRAEGVKQSEVLGTLEAISRALEAAQAELHGE